MKKKIKYKQINNVNDKPTLTLMGICPILRLAQDAQNNLMIGEAVSKFTHKHDNTSILFIRYNNITTYLRAKFCLKGVFQS